MLFWKGNYGGGIHSMIKKRKQAESETVPAPETGAASQAQATGEYASHVYVELEVTCPSRDLLFLYVPANEYQFKVAATIPASLTSPVRASHV